MAIKGQLFATASIVYEALLASRSNMSPESPEHAYRAYNIAEKLWTHCRENALLAQAAARAIGGFLQNVRSSHATDDELISLGLNAAGQLADAFRDPIPAPNMAARRHIPRGPAPQSPPLPEMPPSPSAPEAESPFAAPVVLSPVVVPDFET